MTTPVPDSEERWERFCGEARVTVLHIDSTDTLVVFHVPPEWPQAAFQQMREVLRSGMPSGLKTLIVDGRVALTLVTGSDVISEGS